MKILSVIPQSNYTLTVEAEDGRSGLFDVKPYLGYEAFSTLSIVEEFKKVSSRGYFIEWDCGADLSADTIEAHMEVNSPDLSTIK